MWVTHLCDQSETIRGARDVTGPVVRPLPPPASIDASSRSPLNPKSVKEMADVSFPGDVSWSPATSSVWLRYTLVKIPCRSERPDADAGHSSAVPCRRRLPAPGTGLRVLTCSAGQGRGGVRPSRYMSLWGKPRQGRGEHVTQQWAFSQAYSDLFRSAGGRGNGAGWIRDSCSVHFPPNRFSVMRRPSPPPSLCLSLQIRGERSQLWSVSTPEVPKQQADGAHSPGAHAHARMHQRGHTHAQAHGYSLERA